ncbi:nitrate reductase [Pseudooceanicola sp. CBS1P-1]|uniref:Nitrate reductase n=1 Tax=Pseudooceanicola albus TaxID=2692189 RepID=A0A6L7G7V5_9RHOB|nr:MULTISPECIES: nitrate reductase [Pseudooceanicola]MBT9386264.1 nitrate reductase [Pseudooceanicola endophyticus]MXN20314.1 nitrate reductase [Pseudooceanicola albus]
MTLLDFARGPALYAATLIMVCGLVWRLTGVALLPFRRDLAASGPNAKGRVSGALWQVVSRSFPRRSFLGRTMVTVTIGYAMHIGLAVILLGGAPHILLVTQATGLDWPALPKGIVAIASGVTLVSLLLVILRRLTHPVLRLLSNVDDYLSILLTLIPVLTGILLAEETLLPYETLLTWHILSVEALMIWLPFGKLAHVVFVFAGRAALGARQARKGALQ